MSTKQHYHLVGIGGAGMSALARIYSASGIDVTGSDIRDSPALQSLEQEFGIKTYVGHAADNIVGADLVIATAAVGGSNVEVDAANNSGIPVVTRAKALGRLMAKYPQSIAVSGTHGKTTTSGMIAVMLASAQADPTVVIGGDIPAWQSNARAGASEIFVAEACEAFGSFLELAPAISVITNIEADHLDYYKDISAIRDAFRQMLDSTSYYSVICVDDPEAKSLAEERTENVATYGLSDGASIRAVDIKLGPHPRYTVEILGNTLGEIELSVPGLHNVVNSLAAVAVGNLLDLQFEAIATGLSAFRGTGRRFELVGRTEDDIFVVDDYAHHPTEIVATLSAARTAYPDRRIVAVFQPHLPSRTRDLMDEFAASFSNADLVVLTDIYLSREQAIPGIDGSTLASKTADQKGVDSVVYTADKRDLPQKLSELIHPGDLVITLGAGDIRMAAEGLLELERQKDVRLVNV